MYHTKRKAGKPGNATGLCTNSRGLHQNVFSEQCAHNLNDNEDNKSGTNKKRWRPLFVTWPVEDPTDKSAPPGRHGSSSGGGGVGKAEDGDVSLMENRAQQNLLLCPL